MAYFTTFGTFAVAPSKRIVVAQSRSRDQFPCRCVCIRRAGSGRRKSSQNCDISATVALACDGRPASNDCALDLLERVAEGLRGNWSAGVEDRVLSSANSITAWERSRAANIWSSRFEAKNPIGYRPGFSLVVLVRRAVDPSGRLRHEKVVSNAAIIHDRI